MNTQSQQIGSKSSLIAQQLQFNAENTLSKLTQTIQPNDKFTQESFKRIDQNLMNLPPQILQIQANLQKFRQEKVHHEILAKTLREKEEQLDRSIQQESRQIQLEKLRQNNEFIKQQDQRILENWQQTQATKLERLEKEKQVQDFLTSKIKGQIKEENDIERHNFTTGLDYFTLNCQLQGVDLQRDPALPPQTSKRADIPDSAVMMKIREKKHQNDIALKQREQRRNRMFVQQQQNTQLVAAQKAEEDMIQKFMKYSSDYNRIYDERLEDENREVLMVEKRKLSSEKIDLQRRKYLESIHQKNQDLNKLEDQKRKDEWEEKQLEYRKQNLETKIEKREQHQERMADIIDQLLDITEVCFSSQQKNGDQKIEQKFWNNLLQRFIEGKQIRVDKTIKLFDQSSTGAQPTSTHLANVSYTTKSFTQIQGVPRASFLDYYTGHGPWRPLHIFEGDENILLNLPFNNDPLGNFLHGLVDREYPQLPQKPKPNIPEYMPIKMSIIGSSFSGRKTLANFVQTKYGVQIIIPENIIKEAIALAAPPPEEDDKQKAAAQKKETKKGQPAEEEKKENPELKALGVQISEILAQGETIKDDIIIKAIVIKINELFPPQSPQEILLEIKDAKIKELDQQNELKQIAEEANQQQVAAAAKDQQATKKGGQDAPVVEQAEILETPEEIYRRQMNTKSFEYTKGYVIVGFPQNLDQSKKLQEALTGYVPLEQRLNPEGEAKKVQISDIANPNEKEESNQYQKGGLDLVVMLDAQESECVRRSSNRKIDPQTGIIYHMEDNPPPTDVKGLVQRLQPYNDPQATEQKVRESNTNFLNEGESLQSWFKQFGYEESRFPTYFSQLSIGQASDCFFNVDQQISKLLNIQKKKLDGGENSQSINESQLNKSQLGQVNGAEIQESQKPETPQNNEDDSREAEDEKIAKMFSLLEDKQSKTLIEMWDNIQSNYYNDVRTTLKKLVDHRELVGGRSLSIQDQFLGIVQRPDDKILKILNFQENYNQFYDENKDMVRHSNTKQQLNRHLDALYETLWNSIEIKQNEAIEDRKAIMKSGWIESEIQNIYSIYTRLFQIEMNRIVEIQELFWFLIDSLNNQQIMEVYEHIILDPFPDKAPPIEAKENSYPRIQRLAQYYFDTVEKSSTMLKDMRDRFFKRKRGATSDQQRVQTSQESIQLAENLFSSVLDLEQISAKYRGMVLKNTLISRVKQLRVLGWSLYNRMDDWVIFSIQQENEVIYEAIKSMRSTIQSQAVIKLGPLVIPEISNSYKILNGFAIQPSTILQYEQKVENRFTIFELKLIIDQICSVVNTQGNIDMTSFVNMFLRRKNSNQCQTNLPDYIINYVSLEDVKSIGQRFNSSYQADHVNYKDVITCILLLASPMPSGEDLEIYQSNLLVCADQEEGLISRAQFMEVPAWFDQFEEDTSYYMDYRVEREQIIQEYIFSLYSVYSTDQVNIQNFIVSIERLSNNGYLTFFQQLFGEKQIN